MMRVRKNLKGQPPRGLSWMPKPTEASNLDRGYGIHGYGKPRKAKILRLHSATKPREKKEHRDQRTPNPPLLPPPSGPIRLRQQSAASDRHQTLHCPAA